MTPHKIVGTLLVAVTLACRGTAPDGEDHAHEAAGGHAHVEAESWAVTAWGEHYEVFAETDPLVAGETVVAFSHATVLDGFPPLRSGAVSVILRDAGGREERFRQDVPTRDGIFSVEVRPSAEGSYDLAFVVEGGGVSEEIPAGRVRVGSAADPGGLEQAREERANTVSFLKEQQWQTEFATAWVQEGSLHESLTGPARVRAARGGEVVLTAAADARVAPEPWPYVGLDVAAGAPVFRLDPRAGNRSLPELGAEVSALEAEADAVRKRVDRLHELLELEATSQAELERANASLTGLEARLEAARRGVDVARGASQATHRLDLTAPWRGRVAQVLVSPGQSVAAGAALGRLVKPRPLWLEVAVRPEDVPRLRAGTLGLVLRRASVSEPLEIEADAVHLVAIAPEVDRRTATVAVTLEVDRSTDDLPIGSAVEAEIVLPTERRGIVVPRSALVDDAGVDVVYVQDSGEAFVRREVRIVARQGARLLVEGLRAGERLVTRGPGAIRRSSLLSSGAPERHVH